MVKDLWLPKGFELPDGSKIRSLIYSGVEWQIFDTNISNNILLTTPELARKWFELGILDESMFGRVAFGHKTFSCFGSNNKYTLSGVENGKSPESKLDALAFALALKASRKLSKDASFHDAIYVEQYSRILPVWTLTPHVEDEVVLGTWISGGVAVSTKSFRRLTKLTGWMPVDDLCEIIEAAGFSIPADACLLAKRKPASQLNGGAKSASNTKSACVEIQKPEMPEELAPAKVFKLPGRPQLEEFFNEHIIDITTVRL